MVICIWCVLLVMSHFDVIFMFPNNVLAKFVDKICIFFYTHYPSFMCVIALNIYYQRSKLDIGGKQNQRYDTAAHNCKNIRLRAKTGE